METAANSKTIRITTSLFFFICVPLSIWESSVHSKIFIPQDPASTAQNLLTNEFAFRTSIFSHIVGTVVFIVMVSLLQKVMMPVGKQLAKLMIIPILVQLSIVFIMEAFNYTALMTLKNDARPTFDILHQQELAYVLMRIHRYTFGADKIIFGLFFIPFGILVMRSGFAPKIIGILILIGGMGYVADTGLYILLQREVYLTVQQLKLFSSMSYALGLLWFLIRGIQIRTIPSKNS